MASDQLKQLRELVRLQWPQEVELLVSTLSEAEWDRLGELLRTSERPITRAEVRRCLDAVSVRKAG